MGGFKVWQRNILGSLPFVVDLPGGDKWYRKGGKVRFNQYASYQEKVAMVFSSPAVLTVFKLQCDLFSLAKVSVTENDNELPKDPLIKFIKQPNPFQGQRQWLWDYMFWNMLGCAYLLTWSRVLGGANKMYWLNNDCITFPPALQRKLDKHYFGDKEVEDLLDQKIWYRYKDGTKKEYPLRDIKAFSDLTNGNGNWFGGNSSIDALYKIVTNSEAALDSKNINLNMSGRYMIGGDQGQTDSMYADMMPMPEIEKQSVEEAVQSGKTVHAVRSMVDIKRFVEDIAKLKLDESYFSDYFIIGKMYGIPKDVLEQYLKASTYENQEKARAGHVSYTLDPKGQDLSNGLEMWFGYDDQNKEVQLTWDHLPFVQVFEKDRSLVVERNSKAMEKVVGMGADPNIVGVDFGFDFKYKVKNDGK